MKEMLTCLPASKANSTKPEEVLSKRSTHFTPSATEVNDERCKASFGGTLGPGSSLGWHLHPPRLTSSLSAFNLPGSSGEGDAAF